MSANGHYFYEEAVMSFDALYLSVNIARVIVCQERLNQLLLVRGIQDVRVDTDGQCGCLDSCQRSVKPTPTATDVMQIHGLPMYK